MTERALPQNCLDQRNKRLGAPPSPARFPHAGQRRFAHVEDAVAIGVVEHRSRHVRNRNDDVAANAGVVNCVVDVVDDERVVVV